MILTDSLILGRALITREIPIFVFLEEEKQSALIVAIIAQADKIINRQTTGSLPFHRLTRTSHPPA